MNGAGLEEPFKWSFDQKVEMDLLSNFLLLSGDIQDVQAYFMQRTTIQS